MWAANFFHGRPVDGPEVTRPRSFPPALLRLCVGVEPQAPGHEDGFEDDLARHLRLPLAAVGEGDGHLGHLQPLAVRAVCGLDEKGVALARDAPFEQTRQRTARVAAKAARRVAHAQTRDAT